MSEIDGLFTWYTVERLRSLETVPPWMENERVMKVSDHETIVKGLEARVQELERRLRIPFGKLPCAQCGGPHDFDTSLPSPLWNQVIRAKGLPEYLCTTCIVREFVRANQNFTAELWNEEFNGVPIVVRVNEKSEPSISTAIAEVEKYLHDDLGGGTTNRAKWMRAAAHTIINRLKSLYPSEPESQHHE